MKAISLRQPYASAVVLGSKTIETRTWATKHRGELAIHASKTGFRKGEFASDCWRAALAPLFDDDGNCDLPLGAIVGVVEVTAVFMSNEMHELFLDERRWREFTSGDLIYWTERDMGDFSRGRACWVLEDERMLDTPVQCAGALSIWQVPEHIEKKVRAQL